MKNSVLFRFFLVALSLTVGCKQRMIDPVGAERIYQPSVTESNDEFSVKDTVDRDGYRWVGIEHLTYASTVYGALYSPSGNLKMLMASCQECCLFLGYKIEYNADGMVDQVVMIEEPYDEFTGEEELRFPDEKNIVDFRRWLNDKYLECEHYKICRDTSGRVISIGDMVVPYQYTASYSICEGPYFWTSDLHGGGLCFVVKMSSDDREGSQVDYLYVNGRLKVEMAHWNGVFTQALYYNDDGSFDGICKDRNQDFFQNMMFGNPSRWYLNPYFE